jgi:hypothetical protein
MDGTVKCNLPSTPPSTGLSKIQHLIWTGTILNFKTSAECSYGGYHVIFNVTRKCHSMKSGIWSPNKKNACVLNEKTMGGTKQNGILKGDQRLWSLHITDKTSKSRQHILNGWLKQYLSEEYWNHPIRK